MKPTKAEVTALPAHKFEALFALTLYHRSAEFLHRESIRYIDMVGEETEEGSRTSLFHTSARLWHGLWVASVYVVHEGFVQLDVQDLTLDRIRAKGDLTILRRFRNATFHFQPKWRDDRHTALIMGDLTSWVQELHTRHGQLIKKMAGFAARYHPLKSKTL